VAFRLVSEQIRSAVCPTSAEVRPDRRPPPVRYGLSSNWGRALRITTAAMSLILNTGISLWDGHYFAALLDSFLLQIHPARPPCSDGSPVADLSSGIYGRLPDN
jgi:hypothetical protein